MKRSQNSKNFITFIVIAGNDVGFGHLNRSISLSKHAEKMNFKVSFLIFGDRKTRDIAQKSKIDYFFAYHDMFIESYIEGLFNEIRYKGIFIIDISHSKFIGDFDKIEKIFILFRKFSKKIVVIDTAPNKALAFRLKKKCIDILIIPYVIKTKQKNNSRLELFGPKYAILAPQYRDLKFRKISKFGNKILLTFGGSDPANLSLIALKALFKLKEELDIRIVIGPLFSRYLKFKIKLACFLLRLSKHSISVVRSPKCLADLMLWSDLAITSSGLIKYELAATGTPAIVISTDLFHDEANLAFASKGSILDLGAELFSSSISDQILSILNNYKLRLSMSLSGKRLVDGRGSMRIINELKRSGNA